MAKERFNSQFIMLDFEDLDNPEFMAFVRSSEFSTYLIMRRYIWRSDKPHRLGLHEYYAQGLLASAISREKISEALGVVSPRQITRDINSLIERGIVKSVNTGRCNVFILGKWGRDPDENVYYEYFYADKLGVRLDKNVHPDWTSEIETGQKCPDSLDKSVLADWTNMSTINIEGNKEINIEQRAPSKERSDIPSISNPETEIEELVSSELETLITTCSREFDDMIHLESNLTRAFNLWAKTRFNEAEMLAYVRQARETTKQRIGSSVVRNRQKKMAYFFRVLEDVLGLKKEHE
ncbi:MAG: hypothetical protein ACYCZF_09505 [Anaerolineae bacterium]